MDVIAPFHIAIRQPSKPSRHVVQKYTANVYQHVHSLQFSLLISCLNKPGNFILKNSWCTFGKIKLSSKVKLDYITRQQMDQTHFIMKTLCTVICSLREKGKV